MRCKQDGFRKKMSSTVTPQNVILTQNVITIAAKCNKVFNAKCNNSEIVAFSYKWRKYSAYYINCSALQGIPACRIKGLFESRLNFFK